ncbi:MAG: hypothetical protein PWP23_55 [Candidatus Sumerlaeota bacterium]|nr:hypothetical protein [Candidatus Sumerlaeota bacterium]
MKTSDFKTPEELLGFVQVCLEERNLEAAAQAVGDVRTQFAASALALHIAGFVWEQTFLEKRALGEEPGLELYERAESLYREALEHCREDTIDVHLERLFACLFVLGTQREDVGRLREALAVAERRAARETCEGLAACRRDQATVATAIARATQDPDDWEKAHQCFERAEEPPEGRDALFFHYYRGITRKALGERANDQALLEDAVRSFQAARRHGSVRGLDYLLADCLVQLQNPAAADVLEMKALLPLVLENANPADPLVRSLAARWEVRKRILKDEGYRFDDGRKP